MGHLDKIHSSLSQFMEQRGAHLVIHRKMTEWVTWKYRIRSCMREEKNKTICDIQATHYYEYYNVINMQLAVS